MAQMPIGESNLTCLRPFDSDGFLQATSPLGVVFFWREELLQSCPAAPGKPVRRDPKGCVRVDCMSPPLPPRYPPTDEHGTCTDPRGKTTFLLDRGFGHFHDWWEGTNKWLLCRRGYSARAILATEHAELLHPVPHPDISCPLSFLWTFLKQSLKQS